MGSRITDALMKRPGDDPIKMTAELVLALTGVAADPQERLTAVESHLDDASRGWRSPHLRNIEVR